MKKFTAFSIHMYFLLSSISSFCQEKYFLVFCGNEGTPGHAFVVFGRESNASSSSFIDGSWGLYPQSGKDGSKSFAIGEVPGEIREEGIGKRCDYKVIRMVSQAEYQNALEVKRQWTARGTYELTKSDCVSFMIAVARTVGSMNIPPRSGLDNFPARYLRLLSEVNP